MNPHYKWVYGVGITNRESRCGPAACFSCNRFSRGCHSIASSWTLDSPASASHREGKSHEVHRTALPHCNPPCHARAHGTALQPRTLHRTASHHDTPHHSVPQPFCEKPHQLSAHAHFRLFDSIVKINAHSGTVQRRWDGYPDLFVTEADFVPRTASTRGQNEDDGVLLSVVYNWTEVRSVSVHLIPSASL